MSALEPPDLVADPLPGHLVEAGTFPTRAEAEEHGLVVLALGHPYWLLTRDTGCTLVIERSAAPLATRHLEKYRHERLRWPPPPISDPWAARQVDLVTPLLWAATVLGLHGLAADWKSRAAVDSVAVIRDGELWRAFTALWFHGDAAHVISNALGGILVFAALLSTLGRARGWTLLLLASVAANLALAWAHYPATYRSLGSSTAIFAAVGLLTGRAMRVVARTSHPHRWRALFVPLASGGTVLALHGTGDAQVDLGAHLGGFACGLLGGFLAGLRRAP